MEDRGVPKAVEEQRGVPKAVEEQRGWLQEFETPVGAGGVQQHLIVQQIVVAREMLLNQPSIPG